MHVCVCACMYVCIGNRVCMYVRTRTRTHAHSRAHTHAHTCTLLANPVDEERPACIVTPHMPGGSLDQRLRAGRGGVGGRGEWGGGGCWRFLVDVGRSIENWFAGRLCLCMCVFVCVRACVCMCVLCIRHSPISPRKHPPTTHAHTHTHTHTHTATQTHTHTHTAGGLSVGISAHGGHNTTQTRHTSPRRKACQRPARSPPPCPPR